MIWHFNDRIIVDLILDVETLVRLKGIYNVFVNEEL